MPNAFFEFFESHSFHFYQTIALDKMIERITYFLQLLPHYYNYVEMNWTIITDKHNRNCDFELELELRSRAIYRRFIGSGG